MTSDRFASAHEMVREYAELEAEVLASACM